MRNPFYQEPGVPSAWQLYNQNVNEWQNLRLDRFNNSTDSDDSDDDDSDDEWHPAHSEPDDILSGFDKTCWLPGVRSKRQAATTEKPQEGTTTGGKECKYYFEEVLR